jgi:hypothetical protein
MKPVRRELLNGLFVLVVASLMSAAFAEFQVNFNLQLWVLSVMGVAIAISGYVIFEFVLSAEDREKEWLKRVGTPARSRCGCGGRGFRHGRDCRGDKDYQSGQRYTVIYYFGSEGGEETIFSQQTREGLYSTIIEQLKRGAIREYKRIICFDHDVLANDPELKSGVLASAKDLEPSTDRWEIIFA